MYAQYHSVSLFGARDTSEFEGSSKFTGENIQKGNSFLRTRSVVGDVVKLVVQELPDFRSTAAL